MYLRSCPGLSIPANFDSVFLILNCTSVKEKLSELRVYICSQVHRGTPSMQGFCGALFDETTKPLSGSL